MKELRLLLDDRQDMRCQCAPAAQKTKCVHQKKHGQWAKQVILYSAPLLLDPIWNTTSASAA